ncbi:hypothetical protein [Sorangium sp. So ce1153]|uniref:hypothetical protein n=1 Tax=Sorangium sp. So ce1153 TaxID=3133333 RepID=UPI003F5E8301
MDWSAFTLDVLAPVADRIEERVLGTYHLRADDTGMRVLDRDHPAGVRIPGRRDGRFRAHVTARSEGT